jgi:hypothetical protein
MSALIRRRIALVVAICLATLPALQTAQAAIIHTDTAIEITERQHQIDRIEDVLARESVQQILIKLGVDPLDASVRVQSLTAEELQTLEQKLAELPAGGVIGSVLALCSGCASNIGNTLAELEQYGESVELTDVPFHPQVTDQCGPAALASILNSSAIPASPEELRSRVYIPEREGSLQLELLGATRHYGRIPYVIDPESGSKNAAHLALRCRHWLPAERKEVRPAFR